MKHDKHIKVTDVADMLSISRSTVWAWVKDGRLPSPIKIGGRCTRWSMNDILGCINKMHNAGA